MRRNYFRKADNSSTNTFDFTTNTSTNTKTICAVDSKIVTSIVKAVKKSSDWNIKRIYNNLAHFPYGVILLNDKKWWLRIEIYNDKRFKCFYYALNNFNFVDFDFSDEHEDLHDMIQEVILMGKNNT